MTEPAGSPAASPQVDSNTAAQRALLQAAMTNWAGVVRDASSLGLASQSLRRVVAELGPSLRPRRGRAAEPDRRRQGPAGGRDREGGDARFAGALGLPGDFTQLRLQAVARDKVRRPARASR